LHVKKEKVATCSSYNINSDFSETVKKVEKRALLITPEDKSNKQQNQATHSFSLATNQGRTQGEGLGLKTPP